MSADEAQSAVTAAQPPPTPSGNVVPLKIRSPTEMMMYATGTQSTSCCQVIVRSASLAVTPPAPSRRMYAIVGGIQPAISRPLTRSHRKRLHRWDDLTAQRVAVAI